MDRRLPAAAPDAAGPTYFEITTALALLHFARRKVDAAVLEVGMGGRLDSTNVCRPLVSVITSIGYDHTQQLGDTLAAIAREKAGIIKPGIPVVSGVVEEAPRRVIREICLERRCRLVERAVDFEVDYRPPRHLQRAAASAELDFRSLGGGEPGSYAALPLGLPGRHQAANAAVAVAVLGELRRQGWLAPEAAIRSGLGEARCAARVEVVRRRPAVVLDVAHNPASAAALVDTLQESFSARRRILILAATQEKDHRGMLRLLLPRFDEVLLTRYRDNPRATPPEQLQALARELNGRECPVYGDAAEAWRAAEAMAAADDLICITGSFFIAAEMRRLLGAARRA